MTDEEFAEICSAHPDLSFELNSTGELIVEPPRYSMVGASNNAVGAQLLNWADLEGRGVACDSSTGYTLPNGAPRSRTPPGF